MVEIDAFDVHHTKTKKCSPRAQGHRILLRFMQLLSKKECARTHARKYGKNG